MFAPAGKTMHHFSNLLLPVPLGLLYSEPFRFILHRDRYKDGGSVMAEREEGVTSSYQSSLSPVSRWVRFCRGLWRVMLYIWGTLIVGIVVSTVANLNTTATDTPLSKLYFVYVAITYPLPTGASLGVLVLLTILSWIGSRRYHPTKTRPPSQENRDQMLGRLARRYEQLLAPPSQGGVQVELGLVYRPEPYRMQQTLLTNRNRRLQLSLPSCRSMGR